MSAVIFQPAKTAMQSGRGRTHAWVLEFDLETARRIDPLMGWTSSSDMNQELQLRFESKQAAVAFCEKHQIAHQVREPKPRRVRGRTYADNFSFYKSRGPGSAPVERP